MSLTRSIEGRLWVSLETAASCYRVEVAWLDEVYETGLLGSGQEIDGATLIAAAMLDRLGEIVRLHHQQGVNLAGIVAMLESRR